MQMVRMLYYYFMLVLIVGLLSGCAPKLRTITNSITSSPSEATLSFALKKDAPYNELGKTPYYNSLTSQFPYWNAGFYRIEKRGYRRLTREVDRTSSNRNFHVKLEPLPKVPVPPKVEYPDPDSVAIKPLTLDIPENNSFKLTKAHKIATMTFKQHEGTGAGSLVADSLILNLQRLGYNVIDREMIENVFKEQNLIAEGKTSLSDIEVSKKIGALFNADYFISGAITEYSAISQNVNLSPMIKESELSRYKDDYDEYVKYYQEEDLPLPERIRSIQEWEIEYASKPKSSYINIAKVGITLKIVDIRTSKIVWVGMAYTSDLRLQNGMKRIVEEIIKRFSGNT